jgi:hypothetical protein
VIGAFGRSLKGCQQRDFHDEVFKEPAVIFDTPYFPHDIYGSMAMAEVVTGAGFIDRTAR